MKIGRGKSFTTWQRFSTHFSSDSTSTRRSEKRARCVLIRLRSVAMHLRIQPMNASNISRAKSGSFNSRKYNFKTPATEFISRPVIFTSGSSPLSNTSLNWLISTWAPGTRKMPWNSVSRRRERQLTLTWLCRPSRLIALTHEEMIKGICCSVTWM